MAIFGHQHGLYPFFRPRIRIMLKCMFRWKAFQKYINQFIKTESKKKPFLNFSFMYETVNRLHDAFVKPSTLNDLKSIQVNDSFQKSVLIKSLKESSRSHFRLNILR
jgi:hypothetical protein